MSKSKDCRSKSRRRFKAHAAATEPVLAIIGGKGGVGTTTVGLGVADALAREGAVPGDAGGPVVLDADRTMPDVGRRAGCEGGGVAGYAHGAPLEAVARRPPRLEDGVRVLPAAPGLDGPAVRRALRRLGCTGRPALVDCPSGVGPDAAAPLRAADASLLVTRATEPALHGAATAAAMARAIGAPPVGAVVVATEGPPPLDRLLGCQVLAGVPEVDRPLGRTVARRAYRRISSRIGARTLISVDRPNTGDGRPVADGHRRARP